MKRLCAITLLICMLTGCATSVPSAKEQFYAMDTFMDLSVWGHDSRQAVEELQNMISALETTWDATSPDSVPRRLDSEAPPALSQQEQALLDQVQALQARTDGCFDPYLFAVSQCWGFYDKNYQIPGQEELEQAMQLKQLDLGGALKGYCGDLAVDILDRLDVDYGVLSLGGNIQTYGSKPDGSPFKIGIQNPDGGNPAGTLSVTGTTAVVTSGDYQRCFQQDGTTYHHILDPRTGFPARSGLRSVTVICKSGLVADCLSTALFVMGLEESIRFWQDSNDFEAVFLTEDGTVYATDGAILEGCEYEVIRR